jgi:superfamily II DNA or RNA helicase
MNNLFDHERMIDVGPHEFRRSVQRLLLQNDFDVFSVDGPGDGGGDLYCEKNSERWIIQSKWKKNGKVGPKVIEEILKARVKYDAHQSIIVTNQIFSGTTITRAAQLQGEGLKLDLWTGSNLRQFNRESPVWRTQKTLRPYQNLAFQELQKDLSDNGRALLYLATGMGKTVVAGAVIRNLIAEKPNAKVLLLAHMNELIEQLQKALWEDLPLHVMSQIVNSDNAPDLLDGLTVATNLSIEKYIDAGYKPDLLIIDECHHIGKNNTYRKIISKLSEVPILGVTATPWRGDRFQIETIFGKPSYTCGIEEGMKKGYLSPVDYRLYCDNINWEIVPELSRNEYSIKQLNRKLFIPQRDEQIVDALIETWIEESTPKCIVFCQSVVHAERMHKKLVAYDRWKTAEIIHSKLKKNERRMALLRFRSKECPVLVAVDILNEGVDIPNVNIVCFARVTHSRKIFVQQLGRGLRVADGKVKVTVLDFAADTRRLASIYNLQSAVQKTDPIEDVELKDNKIHFKDERAKSLIEEWIRDAADLETLDQESRLQFPQVTLN